MDELHARGQKVWVYTSSGRRARWIRWWLRLHGVRIDDPTAPDALPVPADYVKTAEINLDGDILIEYLNPNSPAYFSPQASSDVARLM